MQAHVGRRAPYQTDEVDDGKDANSRFDNKINSFWRVDECDGRNVFALAEEENLIKQTFPVYKEGLRLTESRPNCNKQGF